MSLQTMRPLLALTFCFAALVAAAQNNNSPLPSASSNYRISGIVVSKIDGHPLDRARVLLSDTKSRRETESVVTSADGKFSFANLSAGKYALEGTKRGFISAAYDQHDQYSTAIVTGADLVTENLVLKLSPEAVISGRVLDEAGEPVRRGLLTLYRNNHIQGIDEIQAFRQAQTDDLGAYELTSLLPGTYFLSVRAEPWYAFHPAPASNEAGAEGNKARADVDRSLDVAYPLTYYENATETDSATPIQIRGGERLQIDMDLNPVPALRLIFHMPQEPNQGTLFPQLHQKAFEGTSFVQGNPQFISPGVVELTGIPAGRYDVRVQGSNTLTQLNGVDLNEDGEEIDTSRAEALGSMKISVTGPGESTLPKDLAVVLASTPRNGSGGFRNLNAKGEAEIQQVAAGLYRVGVFSPRAAYVVVGISAEGAQVRGRTVIVPAGASAAVALTIAQGVDVQGVAQKAGKPFAEAMVVIVPSDPEANRDLFRRDQSDLDGTFGLRNVVPGSYTLVAIEDGWDLDWSRPEVISPYVKRGRPVKVLLDPSRPTQIREPIEVQAK